jgi:hypothetical protein
MSCALNLINSLNTKIPYFVGNPGTILGQAYTYGGVKSINGIPTLLSSVLNVRGLKIEILHVKHVMCTKFDIYVFIKERKNLTCNHPPVNFVNAIYQCYLKSNDLPLYY